MSHDSTVVVRHVVIRLWEILGRVMVIVQGQSELLEVVLALRAAGRLASLLNGRQEQCDQDGDNRDHNQSLNEREAATGRWITGRTEFLGLAASRASS